MPRALALLALCFLSLAPGGAVAGSSPEGSPFGAFTWSIGAGPAVPLFNASKHFPVGGQLNLGLGYRLFDRLAVQVDYLYSNYGIMSDFLEPGSFNASHTVQAGNLNLLLSVLPESDAADLYVVAGPGLYARTIEITSVTGGPIPTFCEPALFLCATSTSPFPTTLARATRTDPGLNAGFGLSLSLGVPVRLFLDVRIHLIWGTINTPIGQRTVNGQYIPISVGFRYF